MLEMAKKNGAGLTGARRIPWEREGGEMDQQHPKLGTMPVPASGTRRPPLAKYLSHGAAPSPSRTV
jgi:hypothetical protein